MSCTIIPLCVFCFFFFFQAEDGIRDRDVTGVQTCALPICASSPRRAGRSPSVKSTLMIDRVSTGLPKLDAMLGGGLLPRTLTCVYGATGIGKTHLGLTFAEHGRVAAGARGIVLDMTGRGASQQHDEYAARLAGWTPGDWTHAVPPMTEPYPPSEPMQAPYANPLRWVGRG